MNINDYKKKYDELPEKKNLKGKEALEAVKKDGDALKYVTEQTLEICLEAVKQDGYTLRFVSEQTPEICLEAVKQESFALRYVNENIFDKEPTIQIDGKNFSVSTIKEALKEYVK